MAEIQIVKTLENF